PLTNPARLEQERPGALRDFHTLWIPVRFQEGRVSAWNLLWDSASTEQVFQSAGRIVLIDLDSAGDIDAHALFSSLQGSSPGCRWIQKTTTGSNNKTPHLFVYDELAAAVMIDPSLVTVDEQPWEMEQIKEDHLYLRKKAEGRVFVASFKEPEQAMAVLKALWEKELHSRPPEHRDLTLSPKVRIKAFHGHLGPYVVLGFRMGALALRKLGAEGHFDVSAEVHSMLQPPCSCIIDGIQLGSGCTLGKRNIQVLGFEGPAYAVFTGQDGAKVVVRLKPDIPDLVTALVNEKGVEPAGEIFLNMEEKVLFETDALND
ncbi:MAG: formylmethanofuran dehydrogenase subunit E family protein, partial [Planctomycetes bacterium]|nr:formylmethanofuran dehydrogenase subunit E family protein [Planctomycetota bacterium]